jgi:ribonuclease R
MRGYIELHGGKLGIQSDTFIPIQSSEFIPTDYVDYTHNTIKLISRIEHVTVAIVRLNRSLYFPQWGPSCPFAPYVSGPYNPGDRLVVFLHSDGHITVRHHYTSDPIHDKECLVQAYREFTPAIYQDVFEPGMPLYTKEHVDHSELDTFTIDPSTTIDVDDAISVDISQRTIYIHIVDIIRAHLSLPEIQRMSTQCSTLYLSNEHTEHLLSHERLEQLSLHVGVERQAITVKAVLTQEGMVDSYDIYPSTIRVKKRYSYDMVDSELRPEWTFLQDIVKQRSTHQTHQLDMPSIRFTVDKNTGLVSESHLEATNHGSHTMVAMAMVLANLIVSNHLHKNQVVIPNRFHEQLRSYPYDTPLSDNSHVDSYIRIKKYARAVYSVDQRGHFGLGLIDYVHFTSPMRRYADVLIHALLAGVSLPLLEEHVDILNRHVNQVRSFQTMYTTWKMTRWMATVPVHTVWITRVMKSGAMWFIPSMSISGYTHISMLYPKQYWAWNVVDNSLHGQSTNHVIETGKVYRGIIQDVDPITSNINLLIHPL